MRFLIPTCFLLVPLSGRAISQLAGFDPILKIPVCTGLVTDCFSGNLLNGRGSKGPELNAPNTLNSICLDGNFGSYHVDESNDSLRVYASDGSSPLAVGQSVIIEASVWAYTGFSSDKLDLFYSVDASSNIWQFLTTLAPTKSGKNLLKTNFQLKPGKKIQSIRAVFRFGGSALSCNPGSYNDHDELAFSVEGTETPDTTPPTVTLTSPTSGAQVFGNVAISALASDNVGVTRVEFWLAGQRLATVMKPPFDFAWNSESMANGQVEISALAFDALGNQGKSSLLVTVSNTLEVNKCTINTDRPLLVASITPAEPNIPTRMVKALSLFAPSESSRVDFASSISVPSTTTTPLLESEIKSPFNIWQNFSALVQVQCPYRSDLARTCITQDPYANVGCILPSFSISSASLVPGSDLWLRVADVQGIAPSSATNHISSGRLFIQPFSNTRNNLTISDEAKNLSSINGIFTFQGSDTNGMTKLFSINSQGKINQVSDFNPSLSDNLTSGPLNTSLGLFFGLSFGQTKASLFSFDGNLFKQISNRDFKMVLPLGEYKGEFIFVGSNSSGFSKLFRYNGVSLKMSDLRGSSSLPDFPLMVSPGLVFNDKFYFVAYNSEGVEKIFSFDGITFHQIQGMNASNVRDVAGRDPSPVVSNGKMFFVGRDSGNYSILWSFDGLNLTKIAGIKPSVSTFRLISFKEEILLVSSNPRTKLFKYDGLRVNQILDLGGGLRDDFNDFSPVIYGQLLYFWGVTKDQVQKLFAYDGKSFLQIMDLNGPFKHDIPTFGAEMIVSSNKLYFNAINSYGVSKLYSVCDFSMGCSP